MPTRHVRVAAISPAAHQVVLVELRADAQAQDGPQLPAFTAGAHIDLHLAPGLVRSYSLLNSQDERHRYVLAVQRDANTRGGSAHVHEHLREGMRIEISEPRNHFPLDEGAAHTVLIAGGIGITPLHAMALRLQALGRSWQMHYCARTREHAALREELAARHGAKVRFNFDGEPGGRMLDIAQVIGEAPAGTHFYCCGPTPMIAAFEKAAAHLPPAQVHREYFSAAGAPAAPAARASYLVRLARSDMAFEVGPGETILDKLIERNFDVAYSCREGVCGSCETAVLEGTPDHHDLVLTAAEQAAGRTMMVCCSGARSSHLVLDL